MPYPSFYVLERLRSESDNYILMTVKYCEGWSPTILSYQGSWTHPFWGEALLVSLAFQSCICVCFAFCLFEILSG